MAFFYSSVFRGMDDVLLLILVLRDVLSRNQPLWHPWAEFFRGKNKMAAKYFKVKYDFSTNEARNKCITSFSCDFDWAIHFLYYFDDSRPSSRSKKTISRSKKQKCYFKQIKIGTCVIPLLHGIFSRNECMVLFC